MRWMVIGPSGAGKTAFCHAMAGTVDWNALRRTQMLSFIGNYIDTPGIYLEYSRFYPALIICEQQADAILFLVGADQKGQPFPGGIARMFSRPVFGAVSKADLAEGDLKRARALLKFAGIRPPYSVLSAIGKDGLKEWKDRIEIMKGENSYDTGSVRID
ncbi:EutP/PduV family microcompartment system protein [Caproiciproducens sp.]